MLEAMDGGGKEAGLDQQEQTLWNLRMIMSRGFPNPGELAGPDMWPGLRTGGGFRANFTVAMAITCKRPGMLKIRTPNGYYPQ